VIRAVRNAENVPAPLNGDNRIFATWLLLTVPLAYRSPLVHDQIRGTWSDKKPEFVLSVNCYKIESTERVLILRRIFHLDRNVVTSTKKEKASISLLRRAARKRLAVICISALSCPK
jgi:hypothetical protein